MGKPHPLEPLVLAIMRDDPCQDTPKLAHLLSGEANLKRNRKIPAFGVSGNRAYRVVAADVLGYMESQGKLRQDEQGWFRVVANPTP